MRLALAALVLAGALYARPADAASCANCEDSGTGACVCDEFSGRDPNTTDSISPYYNLIECKTGSDPVVPADRGAWSSAQLERCWWVDTDCTTGSYTWVFRCPDRDYSLPEFLGTVLDSEGVQPGGAPHSILQVGSTLELSNPDPNTVRLEISATYKPSPTATELIGWGTCPAIAPAPTCDIDTTWNIQYALGGRLQIDGAAVSPGRPLFQRLIYQPSDAQKRYFRWGESVTAESATTVASAKTLPMPRRLLIQNAYLDVASTSTGEKTAFSTAGTLRFGVHINGVDHELCTLANGDANGNRCAGLSREVPEDAAAAWYLDCTDGCTDTGTYAVNIAVGGL